MGIRGTELIQENKSIQERIALSLTFVDSEGKKKSFALNKNKLLLGRSPHADINIDHPQFSFYHAFLFIDGYGSGKIIDLESENGIFINGNKISESFFTVGDHLSIGSFEFFVEETVLKSEDSFEVRDTEVTIAEPGGFVDSISTDEDIDISELTLVDDEYCNLHFEESGFSGLAVDPFYEMIDIHNDWEYLYDEQKVEREVIAKENESLSISVSCFTGDRLISTDVYPMKRGTYFFNGKKKGEQKVLIDFLRKDEKFPVIDVRGEEVTINSFGDFALRYLDIPNDNNETCPPPIFLKDIERRGDSNRPRIEKLALKENQVVLLEFKTISILIKLVPTPPKLKAAPWIENDPEFFKKVGGFLLFGLLFLISSLFIEKAQEPEEEVTIIYKRKDAFKKAPKVLAKAAQVKMDNPENLKPEKVKTQKSAAKKQNTPKKQKKVASTQPKSQNKQQVKVKKTIAKVQTYKFDMASSVNQMLAKSGDLSKVKLKNTGKGNIKVANTAVGETSNLNVKEATMDGTGGSLGKTGKFAANAAMGAKGLVDSKGAFTSFIEAKTVVLGSIDPELLRKILRKYIPQFRHCYQQELEFHNDKLEGVVDLDFRINGKGKVSKVKVLSKNGKFSAEGTNCMARVLTIIQFPKPKGGGVVDVRQPLNFYSEK